MNIQRYLNLRSNALAISRLNLLDIELVGTAFGKEHEFLPSNTLLAKLKKTGDIVGILHYQPVTFKGAVSTMIEWLCVLPEYRQKGYGLQLLLACLRENKENVVLLQGVEPFLREWYFKIGFLATNLQHMMLLYPEANKAFLSTQQ